MIKDPSVFATKILELVKSGIEINENSTQNKLRPSSILKNKAKMQENKPASRHASHRNASKKQKSSE